MCFMKIFRTTFLRNTSRQLHLQNMFFYIKRSIAEIFYFHDILRVAMLLPVKF